MYLCVGFCTMNAVPKEATEDIRSPGAGVIGFNVQPGINARSQTLDEQSSLLTAEPSLQP